MPELEIKVPSYIGESYMDWDSCEWVQGITWNDIDMFLGWAEMMGEKADSILLSIGACDGGSTLEGFNIYNKLRALGLPIRTHITGYAASMGVPVALASDELPEMDYTAQLMLHAASFSNGTSAETSAELRAGADRLDNTNQLLFDLLTARTGQPADVVNGWLSPKETWLTATQAKAVGLCSKVNPIPVGTTATQADTLITARRARTSQAIARADKRAAVSAALPASPMPAANAPASTSVPMATAAPKPSPRTAATSAAKAPQARKTLFTQLKEMFAGIDEEEEAEATAQAGTTESTELENGAFLYTDGPIAVDSAVFNDEAMTEATADGDYGTADGQVITVAAGVVTKIGPDTTTAAAPAAEATALAKRLDALEAKLSTVEAAKASLETENARLKAAKPPMPQARGNRKDAPDPKAAGTGKAALAPHHATL